MQKLLRGLCVSLLREFLAIVRFIRRSKDQIKRDVRTAAEKDGKVQ